MEASPQGEATPVAHSDVTPPPALQEDSDVITEAPAIDHAPADAPEITTMQASEEATTLNVEPKRGRGRPRKRPVIVDEKVMNEPQRLQGGKEIGGNTGVKGIGTSTGPQRLAKRIVEVFANRDVALAKAVTTLVLEGEPLAQGSQRSPSPPLAYDLSGSSQFDNYSTRLRLETATFPSAISANSLSLDPSYSPLLKNPPPQDNSICALGPQPRHPTGCVHGPGVWRCLEGL